MIISNTLSRAHLNEATEETPEDEIKAQIHMVYIKSRALNNMGAIKKETHQDDALMEVIDYTINGWPKRKKVSTEANRISFNTSVTKVKLHPFRIVL